MIVKLLTEHPLEFLSLKGGCRGSSESTHVKMPHCRKSHATAHFIVYVNCHIVTFYTARCGISSRSSLLAKTKSIPKKKIKYFFFWKL